MKAIAPTDIQTLIELFEQSPWQRLHVRVEGLDLFLAKDPGARRPEDLFATQSPGHQGLPLQQGLGRTNATIAAAAAQGTPRGSRPTRGY